jgi:hypothetical protein
VERYRLLRGVHYYSSYCKIEQRSLEDLLLVEYLKSNQFAKECLILFSMANDGYDPVSGFDGLRCLSLGCEVVAEGPFLLHWIYHVVAPVSPRVLLLTTHVSFYSTAAAK